LGKSAGLFLKAWWLTIPGALVLCYFAFIYLPSLFVVLQSGGLGYITLVIPTLLVAVTLVFGLIVLNTRSDTIGHTGIPMRSYPWLLGACAIVVIGLSAYVLAQPVSGRIVILAQANLLVLLGFGLGFGVVWKITRLREALAYSYAAGPVVFRDTRLARGLFLGLMLVSIALVAFYISQLEVIPLLDQILRFRDIQGGAIARENSWKLMLSGPMAYLLSWLRALILPVSALFSFGAWRNTRARFWLGAFIFSFILALLFAALTTSRMPVMAIIIMLAIYMAWSGVRWRWLLGMAGAAFGVMFLFDFLRNGHDLTLSGSIILNQMVRLFYSPASDLYSYFVAFPLDSGYLWGRSISFMPGYFDTAAWVAKVQGAAISSASSTAAFPGNAFADAGLAGVFIEAVIVGAIALGAQILLFKSAKTVLATALAAFLVVTMYILTQTNLTTTLGTGGLLLALAALIILYLIGKQRDRQKPIKPRADGTGN
jgi:hypothetical protein